MKSTGAIIDGIYYKDSGMPVDATQSTMYKQYSHEKQRQEHGIDLIQPFVNGKPNEEFRIHYPEQAEEYFGKH